MLDGINGAATLYFFSVLFFSSLYINNFFVVSAVFPFVFFFLINNFKNKIFLGNNGSMLLAFFLSIIFIKYYNLELIFYSDQIFIFMMIPGFDLLRLAVVRSFNNRHPFSPDKNHLHHILLYNYGYYIAISWIFFLIVVPIIIFFLFNNSITSVLIGLLLYICTFLFCKNRLN
jgi:UDP-N-acetylmuramyl pentapeptide phosphotransferase/UDP-N-acetylglucosamine-1-phosphate transferase